MRLSRRSTSLAAVALAALSVSACNDEPAAIAVPDPAPPAYIAAIDPLPYADPAPVSWYGPDRGYQWAERAYGLQQAFYEAPPDYGFDYGGVEPWVWESTDDWAMYAEPWDDGYRYYYYEPGAAYPYFVRDDRYGYGFDAAGVLVALFDADGDYLPMEYFYEAAPLAGRYYLRGRDLRNAARQARRERVVETAWVERAPLIYQTSRPFLAAAERDDSWRTWRQRNGDTERRRFVREERRRDELRTAALAAPPQIREERRLERGAQQVWREERRENRRESQRLERHRQQVAHAARRQEDRQPRAVQPSRREDHREIQRLERQRQQTAQAERRNEARMREASRAAEARGRRQAERAAQARRGEARAQQMARAAEERGRREGARGAEQQARDAAFRDRGGGPDRAQRPERVQRPERPQRQEAGGRPDRGGGADRGPRGEGKGGGKKD